MHGSVIRQMYAGFVLIIVMFAITISITINGMRSIHQNFEGVTSSVLPLVSLSNQTSVQLLSADKSFKDFLTTQDSTIMETRRDEFRKAQQSFQSVLEQLAAASRAYPSLNDQIYALRQLETRYFNEAYDAMDNYQAMFSAQETVQQSTRQFQRLHSSLSVGMRELVDQQTSVSIKMMANGYFMRLRSAELITSDALASSDPEFVETSLARNRKAVSQLNDAFRGLAAQLPELNRSFAESMQQFSRDVGHKGGVLDQHNEYLQARNALYENIANLAKDVDNAIVILDTFNQTANQDLNSALNDAGAIYNSGVLRALAIGLMVALIAAAIGYHIAHSVRQPLRSMLTTLESLTKGDMTRRITIHKKNEFARVSSHINSLADNLHDILKQLNTASDNLTNTANTNQSTSLHAQQKLDAQRGQTASVATAMTEMAHSVQEVANNAKQSLQMVQQVEEASQSGRKVMNDNITTINQLEARLTDSVNAVSELHRMSSQIGTILDVIRNIAEQTNLLALNAAIEAARAGEQGRGFAVVADEVRVLAQKTTHSTSEIETMISNLQSSSHTASKVIESCMTDMTQSVDKASSANSTMEEIQALIINISQMSTHISQAAVEQHETTNAIARSIEDITHIADESYQAMSEIAKTSSNLSHLAEQQGQLVHRFTL